MNVLVTGGTGTLGRYFVESAVETGHNIRILSRQPRPQNNEEEVEWAQSDLTTGDGLSEALRGIDAIVHCATSPGFGAKKVDIKGTRRLVKSAQKHGVDHFVYPSIVGIDHIPFNYYQCKLEAEQIIEESDIPHTILRATQFHSLANQLISTAMRFPFVAPLPANFKFQTVAATEVAEQLNQCLEQNPNGRLPNFGGPNISSLKEMARVWLKAKQKQKRIIRLPLPGQTAKAFRQGNGTDPSRQMGEITWEKWLNSPSTE